MSEKMPAGPLPSRSASIERDMERELTPFERGVVMYAVNRVLETLLAEWLRRSQAPRSVELKALRSEALHAIAPGILAAVRAGNEAEFTATWTRSDAISQLSAEAAMVWSMQRAGLR